MLIFIVVAVILVLMAVLGTQIVRTQEIERENRLMESYMISLQGFYGMLQSRIEVTRKYRHDLARHIQTLEALLEKSRANEEMQTYVDGLKSKYQNLKICNYCEDEIVNSILEMKAETCRNENIELDIDVCGKYFDGWDSVDLVGLLHNLWDNAIEACQRLKNGMDKAIKFSMMQDGSTLCIEIKNRICPDEKITFATSKKNKNEHGIGMFIIRDLAKKYNGNVEAVAEDGWMSIKVEMNGKKAV